MGRGAGRAPLEGPAYGVGLLSRRPLIDAERTVLPGGGLGGRRSEDLGRAGITIATSYLSYLAWREAAAAARRRIVGRRGRAPHAADGGT